MIRSLVIRLRRLLRRRPPTVLHHGDLDPEGILAQLLARND